MLSRILPAFSVVAALCAPAAAVEPQPKLAGDTHIHDPSAIEIGHEFFAFGTGEVGRNRGAARIKSSPDGVTWSNRGALGAGVPDWTLPKLGFLPVALWAPSVSRRGGRLNIYYSVSSFRGNDSAIGLLTTDAFDPAQPGKNWQDRGLVLMSKAGDDFNAIDPYRIDLSDGRAFLSYGSYWSGIKLRPLDPESGMLLKPEAPAITLAARSDGGVVEASALWEHAGKFYLFVSFDKCCLGVASTYNMRIGRADRIEGPYLDKTGKDMREGGGSPLQASAGRFVGPGGQEPLRTDKGDMIVYHYYDAQDGGSAKLQLSPLGWTADGWPELGPPPL